MSQLTLAARARRCQARAAMTAHRDRASFLSCCNFHNEGALSNRDTPETAIRLLKAEQPSPACFISAEAIERIVGQIGETQKATRELSGGSTLGSTDFGSFAAADAGGIEALRSGASMSSSPAIPTNVKSA